jgi:uncharacterized protein YfaT (DUF1175 family)
VENGRLIARSSVVTSTSRLLSAVVGFVVLADALLLAQLRLADESDRAAFRRWFVLLADTAFYQPPAEVTDCAALVRYAMREALRPHTAEWRRRAGLPALDLPADVRERPPARDGMMPLFRVSARAGDPRAEFADAMTIIRWNTRLVSRDLRDARPADLLYFRQPDQRQPDHLMIVVGTSPLDPSAHDFVVYHTGPDDEGSGEIRKVRAADLARHPAPQWRPQPSNAAFVGVFRLIAAS